MGKREQMTCQDCKYFDADNHPTIFSFMSRAGHCDKRIADGYDEYPMPDCYACDMFEPKEDSWESVSK